MQLKILGVQGSTNIKTITAVIRDMGAEEAAAILTTTGLTDAEAANILVKKGLCSSTEDALNVLAAQSAGNVAAAGSTDLLTAASLRLKAALQGIGATIKAHPILAAVTAAVAVIAGVAKGVDYIMTKSERLSDKLSETKEAISETTENLNSLESKLSDTKGRIDELNSMSSLTIVEQQELSNLKEVTAQLERQIELEKTRKRIENRQATEDFINWFDSDIHTYGEYNYKGQGSAEANQKESRNAVSYGEHKFQYWWNELGGSTKYLDEEKYINDRFDYLSELISKRSTETNEDEKKNIDNNIKEVFSYLESKSKEFDSQMEGLELDYIPNAKEGSQEAKINEIIEFVDTFNDKLLLAESKANGATSDSYNRIFKNAISSSRFSEAAKQIEKLKKTENGAERTTKQFNKALLDTINSSAYKGSNLEQLINYLKNDLGFNIDISGEEQLMSLSSMFVEIKDKQDKATQSNLLFADSFSKITSARKAFEEGLSSVETGTEDFTSYADSYEKAMELLNKGYDLDNGVLMAHVERLISDKQLKKLGYDADKVKAYLQEHLKGVFGDKDTDAPGNGLIDKIEKNADENGKIYAKDKNGNIDKTRELASYKDGKWHISDDTKDIEALGKEFGMTTDQILSCIKAMKTFSDVDLNDTETIIDKLKEEGKVFDPEEEKKKKVKKLADKYNSYTNGNVDYNKRPVISAKNMQEAGWKEFPNGSTATTYSSGMDVGKYSIEITPILENGEVLSPDALDKYVKELVGEGSIEDLLKSDKKKLIINAKEGSYEENSEYWDSWNKKLDKIKQKHLELTKELTGTKPAVNLKQLESDMQSEGYSSKDIFDTIQQLKNDENVITVEIDAKTKSPKVAEELEKLGIFSGTGTYGKGKSKWTSTTTDDIDKATQALKTFGLTGQEAYEKLKGIDIYETQKDGTQKFLTDVEKIESVIKTFDSDLDLNLYKSINLKGEVPDGGKRTEVINVVPLKEELEKKGYSSQFIDEYIKSLEQQNHVVTIDTSMEFTQKGDVTTVEEQLVAAGVATKDKDGKYTIDVKETVTLLKNTGADSDDIISFLNNLKSAAEQDGSLTLTFSSNVSSIEGEVNNVYQAFDDTKNKANEAKSATEEAKASAEAYNNTSLENIESSWSRTAEQVERNGAAIATAKEMLDAINGSTYTYNVKPVETRPTNVPSDFVGPVLPSKFGVANGTANISGTALAGGNWGTAPGGKTLTGELG